MAKAADKEIEQITSVGDAPGVTIGADEDEEVVTPEKAGAVKEQTTSAASSENVIPEIERLMHYGSNDTAASKMLALGAELNLGGFKQAAESGEELRFVHEGAPISRVTGPLGESYYVLGLKQTLLTLKNMVQ